MEASLRILWALVGIAPVAAQAHSGGLDKYGCHRNSKTGDYHCHGTTPPPPPPPPPPANKLPTVSITSPAAGSNPTLGAINVTASAADSDGNVVRVQFFANGQMVGEDHSSPFSVTWTPSSPGIYTLTSRAIDDDGAATVSAGRTVTVTSPPPPPPPPAPPPPAPPGPPPETATKPTPPASACSQVTLATVIDGDTIDVQLGSLVERIRISQIDAPERSQSFGLEATACLSRLLASGSLTICRDGKDRHGRTIAGVSAGTVKIEQQMVAQGCAWAYTKYLESNSVLPSLEASARAARLGLWALPSYVEPWVYRSGTSPVTFDSSTGRTVVNVTLSNRGTVYDRVFDWAEHQYPKLLAGGTGNQVLDDGTIYRCYSGGFCVGYRPGVFLTYNGSVVREVGTEAQLLSSAEAQGF